MEERRTRYPGFNVLTEVKAWDPHTRQIVMRRLGPFPELQFFQTDEAAVFKTIAGHLTYDYREEILTYVVSWADHRLSSKTGESQRKPGIPHESELIRNGLRSLNYLGTGLYRREFFKLDPEQQFSILAALQTGSAPAATAGNLPQQEFFQKLLDLVIRPYYSHPTIWSEIGYGGPAYPRGYVRVEIGLIDPWEAQHE